MPKTTPKGPGLLGHAFGGADEQINQKLKFLLGQEPLGLKVALSHQSQKAQEKPSAEHPKPSDRITE